LAKAERGTPLADSTSGKLLKYRNGLLMAQAYHAQRRRQHFCLTTPSAFLVALDGADAEPVVDHDLAAKDSREDKHPPRTCKDHVVEGAEFTLVLGELTRGRMANSAFSAIWSLHSFVAYSLFQLPRFFLPTVLPAWTISWMMSVPFAPFSTRRMRWPSKATATLIAAQPLLGTRF
jgi:hypothetical protein